MTAWRSDIEAPQRVQSTQRFSLFSGVSRERWLWAVIALAVVLRLGAAVYLGDRVEVLPGIYDQVSYHTLAMRVLEGHGFTFPSDWWPMTRANEPTAHCSFLYVLYLAGVYAVVGVHPLAARLLQAAVAGVLAPYLAWRLGRRVADGRVGLAAAAITAVYIYFIYYSAALMTETFFILAVLWALDRALVLAERPTWGTALQLGLALGVATLLRQLILAFVPCLLLWLIWQWRGRVRWGMLLTPLLVMALLIAPWTVRNYRVFGRFVLLNTNAGFAFFWANHPIYGTNFPGLLPPDGPSYQDLIPAELRHLDEAAMERALMRRAIGFVLEDPGRYLLLSLSKVREYFKFWPSPDSGVVSNVARVLSFGLFLPFMLFGLVRAARDWRRWSLLYLFGGVYTAIHLLSWTLVRYRLPVDAVLILFAALALVALADGCWRGVFLPQHARGSQGYEKQHCDSFFTAEYAKNF
ncbi:MAG: glycosyltransferase family 39 protein [Anaerolineae bacterium]|nr:glycosyltransferase family 39 protein [Anaerolineae bacterium]MDW8072438.1 glycosyltransferase family 39 protein [Anaerolineae bacterium]